MPTGYDSSRVWYSGNNTDTGNTDYATMAVDAAPRDDVVYYTMNVYGHISIVEEHDERSIAQLLEDADWIL
jgi:hypothetical protein